MPNILSAALLGFLLGLRHATDADHVVAVTAIVARERTIGRAARIGAMWGVIHSHCSSSAARSSRFAW
jgi:high-affinity nickel permease